jgi:hypothetical protein
MPWTNLNQVRVRFSREVAVSAEALLVEGAVVPSYADLPSRFTYEPATFTATWSLAAPLKLDRVRVSLHGVVDLAGNAVADVSLPLSVVPGDADGNGRVNALDLLRVRALLLHRAAGTSGNAAWLFSDVNADGRIAANDFTGVRTRLYSALGPAAPAPTSPRFWAPTAWLSAVWEESEVGLPD